jgi:hypothetical protein
MRAVSYEEGQNFAKKHNLLFMEASAKTLENVEEVMVDPWYIGYNSHFFFSLILFYIVM